MKNQEKRRVALMLALILVVFVFFGIRLMEVQIVDGEKYLAMSKAGSSRIVNVKAARGEIVDRNGKPLAVNRSGFDIQINKAFLPYEEQNEIILRLITLLEENGEEYNDSLPLSKGKPPYTFEEGKDRQIDSLKQKILGLNLYATEENVMDALIEHYKIEGFTDEETRKIAGVRYEMEASGFNISNPFIFAEDISIKTVTQVRENSVTFAGADIVETPYREYVSGDIAPHVIGQIGPIYAEEYEELKAKGYKLNDTLGKAGIERAAENYLRGKDGKNEIFLDSNGRVVDVVETEETIPGNTVYLTIDQDFQKKVQELLENHIFRMQKTAAEGAGRDANAGSAVVIHVPTGEVLAVATYPSYDIGEYLTNYTELSQKEGNPLFNRALNGLYRPGSIYKPSVALAALDMDIVKEEDTVSCQRVYTFFQQYQPTCMAYHGNINVVRAIQESCNIYFYDIGRRMGIRTINDYGNKLGMGIETGIELPESIGYLSSPERSKELGREWYDGDVIQAAIGQLDTIITPLQAATYAATLANGGDRLRTHIIKEVRTYDQGTVVMENKPEVLARSIASPESFAVVQKGMLAVSKQGTNRYYFGNYPLNIATKTGTPQSSSGSNHSAFIAFGPVESSEIAVSVFIEHGGSGLYSAPLVKEIFDAYFYPEGFTAASASPAPSSAPAPIVSP